MLASPAKASPTPLSSTSAPSTKEKDLIMVKIKMEEQMVPSAGFSPPPSSEFYDYPDEYIGYQKQQLYAQQQQQQAQQPQQQQQQVVQQQQGFLAALDIDQFDMSLLDFDDIPIVPSPNCGSGSPTSYEGNWSTQLSLYAASPSEFRSFSPDCKPQLSPFLIHGSSDIHGSSGGEIDANKSTNQNLQDGNGRNLLLRQCLEDLTFQKKHNFKPFEIEIPDNQQNAVTANSLAQAQEVEAMRELMAGFYGPNSSSTASSSEVVGGNLELNQIFRQAFKDYRSDIENTCTLLSISPDPIRWSVSDVQAWLAYTLTTLQTSSVDGPGRFASSANSLRQFWNLDGRSLCSLAEEEFRRRDPAQGEAIFAKLDLWKMLQQSSQPNNSNQQQQGGKQQRPQSVQQQQQQQLEIKIDLDSQVAPSTPPQSLLTENFDLEQILGSSLLTTTSGGSGSVQSSPGIQFVQSDLVEAIRSPASISSAYSSLSSETHHNMATDDDESLELDGVEEEPMDTTTSSSIKTSTKVGKKAGKNPSIKGTIPSGGHKGGAHIHLWQFLKELLSSPGQHGACIRWLDQPRGVFKIEDSVRVARLWGLRKNRPAMNYDKLSRSIRQYYRKGIMRKTERSQRLVYQFCHPYGL